MVSICLRSLLVLLLWAAGFARAGQDGVLDPEFDRLKVEQWLNERNPVHFRFSGGVPRAQLSFHQRLISKVEIRLDGRELASRRGAGQLVFFIQITDPAGTRYQSHEAIELNKLDENIKSANLEYSQPAFFLPGDYQLIAAILDTNTGEHAARQTAFQIEASSRTLLADQWRGLPTVELIAKAESPESWYLPAIRSRLRWNASLRSPRRLNIVVNIAPSVPGRGSRPSPSGGLTALLPTLKALSQMGSSLLAEEVELLDLARRRTAFRQDDVQELDWAGLKKSLGDANTASIDIRSLSDRHHEAQFFVSEIRKLIRVSEMPNVLVVLTTPIAFESGEEREPVSLEGLPACRIVYIRYHDSARPVHTFDQSMRGRSPRLGRPMIFERPQEIIDQLAATLKPLNPKVFDVETPEQMRRALAEIETSLLAAR